MPDPTPTEAEVLAAMTPQDQALYHASMAQRARLMPDADGMVPVRKGEANET